MRRLCYGMIASLIAPLALAQQPECASADADETRAQTLREDGRDLDAVRLLEVVVACERTPRRVARLGLAEAAAGLWVPSEAHLAEALATSDPWVRRVRRELSVQLERVRARVGNLEVIVNAPGAELRIGGAAAATLPMREPLRVPSGALTYEVVAPGFVRELRRVEVVAGTDRLTRENLSLTPEPSAPSRVEPPPAPAPRPSPVHPAEVSLPQRAATPVGPTTPPPRATWMRPAAIALSTVGGALLIGGVVALVVGSDAASIYNDDASCFVAGRGSRDAQCGAQRATAESMESLTYAGLIGSAVMLGAAAGLFVAAPSARRPGEVTVVAGPGELGLALRGVF